MLKTYKKMAADNNTCDSITVDEQIALFTGMLVQKQHLLQRAAMVALQALY